MAARDRERAQLGAVVEDGFDAGAHCDTHVQRWIDAMQARVPGAKGQPHVTVKGGGHFLQARPVRL